MRRPTASNLIVRHRREVDALCRRFGVARLDVFGSALGERSISGSI
jgi:predicted nucleotidyltransferase